MKNRKNRLQKGCVESFWNHPRKAIIQRQKHFTEKLSKDGHIKSSMDSGLLLDGA